MSSSQPSSATPLQSLSMASPHTSLPVGMQTHVPVPSHVGSSAPQLASVRHSTHAFGLNTTLQNGVGAEQSPSSSQASMITSVGGCPELGPLPSVGVSVGGAPSRPEAVMIAWFEIVPLAPASMVTRNFTCAVSPTSIAPPFVPSAPAPSRTNTASAIASYTP